MASPRHFCRTASIGFVAALILTACAGTDSSETAVDTAAGSTTGASGDGILVYATGDAEPTCLDPHVGGNYPQALVSSQYLEPLVGRDADGKITPWLAQDWSVSDDGLTWNITLVPEKTFTDGTPVDAEAISVNIEHLQDPDTGSSTGFMATTKIDSVEAVDATHVRIRMKEPDSALLESLSQPWLAIQSPAGIARGKDANCQDPIGTGPFKVVEWVPQDHITLTRNDDYSTPGPQAVNQGPASIKTIVWRFIPDPATRYAALQSGDVNVIDNPEPGAIADAESNDTIAHVNAPRPGSSNRIELNAGQAPFDDIRVREAFIKSADIGPGIDTLFKGVAPRSYSPLSSVEPMSYSAPDLFTTDVDAANQLLDEAGWTDRDADGYRVKDGERLTARFPISTNQSVAAERALFEQLQANTRQVGFDVLLSPVDLPSWHAAIAAPAPGENATYEIVDAPYSKVGPDVLRILYATSSIIPAPSGYMSNHVQVSDPRIDELLDQAARITDEGERAELYTEVQMRILEGYYILPLYDQQNHFLARGVTDVTSHSAVGTPAFNDATLD